MREDREENVYHTFTEYVQDGRVCIGTQFYEQSYLVDLDYPTYIHKEVIMRRKNVCDTFTDCVYDETPCSYPCGAYLVCPGHLTSVHVGDVDNSNSQIE